MTDYETLIVESEGGVATVWLNRPERLNAFNAQMTQEFYDALARLDRDDAVRAIVVTGKGRCFSAGADLARGGDTFSGPRTDEERAAERRQRQGRVRPWQMLTPVIGALNGSAVGMGLTLPMQWDVRYAAEDAKYGFVFNRRGIQPEAGSTWIVPRLVGLSRAFELLLSGRYFSGREGAEIGLMSKALPAEEVLPAARELARDIATNAAPVSVALTKALVYRFLEEEDRAAAEELESRTFRWTGRQPDAAEGVKAFLEKRDPAWSMSKTKDFPSGMLSGEGEERR